jgi:hypothetical protein
VTIEVPTGATAKDSFGNAEITKGKNFQLDVRTGPQGDAQAMLKACQSLAAGR